MGILTPTFADQHKTNGAGGAHIIAQHEPTREGELIPMTLTGNVSVQAVPVAIPAPLKVALIGTAPSSRMLAPFNDPSWKIWGCSPGNMNALPRFDTWFEIHGNLLWPEHESYGKPYIEWLKTLACPVYMQNQTWVPNAVSFPRLDLVRKFGRGFFTSSFAWMMALAIDQGATEIALYGIDMASRDEYILQRPGFYFFRWLAEQRGIKVSAPHESDIMQYPPLYAYSDVDPLGRKIAARRQEVGGRVGGMIAERDKLSNSIVYLQGAAEDLDYFQSIWSGAADEIALLQDENSYLKREIEQLKASQIQNHLTYAYPATTAVASVLHELKSTPAEIAAFVEEVKSTPAPPPPEPAQVRSKSRSRNSKHA